MQEKTMQIIIAKQDKKLGGIYSITNTSNGKIYWGQTNNFIARAYRHASELKKGTHTNRHLQSAYNLDNSAFVYRVYVIEADKTEKCSIEEQLIELFGENCYNIETKAITPKSKFSATPEETRAKISAANKGRLHSEESRANMSAGRKGMVLSEEHRAKISAGHKGKVRSEEHQAKLNATMKGRVASEESRAKMSAAAKARWTKKKAQ